MSLRPGLPFIAALVAAIVVTGPLFPAGVSAQEPQASIRLLSQPPWHDAHGPLDLKLRVTNTSNQELQGFAIQTKVYARIITRTDLHDSLDGPDGFELRLQAVTFDKTLAPGASEDVRIRTPIAELLGFQEAGVYPMAVSLVDADFTTLLDSFTTELIYYPEAVDKPLNFSLVVPLFGEPWRAPDGTFDDTDELEAAIGPRGWLVGLLRALNRSTDNGAEVALVPSPRTVEELSDVADGYRSADSTEPVTRDEAIPTAGAEVVTGLRALLQKREVAPLASPYAAADLPTVSRELGPGFLTRQLAEGRAVLSRLLPGVALDPRWLFAPGSRWDFETLKSVVAQDRDLRTFFSADSFESPIDDSVAGCPELAPPGSFTCPVGVSNPVEGTTTEGLVRDPDVQDRLVQLARPGGDALDLQLFFAETAFIHLENPDLDGRVVQATLPSSWRPSPAHARVLFDTLAAAPWLRALTPTRALAAGERPRPRQTVARAPGLEGLPDPSYFSQITAAEGRLNLYAEIGPPAERLERLRRNLLVAQSRGWWIDTATEARGLAYAAQTFDEIEREFDKVRVDALDTTLTSRRSPIQLFVYNDTDYPVTVDITLGEATDEIRVADSDLDELQDITVQPRQQVDIDVEVIAESSGIFSLNAAVTTPDSGEEIYSENIRIRSTNFNVIALGITFGALGFLILFYVIRLMRRRRAPRAEGSPA